MHGAWHTSQCWSKVVPLLKAEGHFVLALDLPGHGNNIKNFAAISLNSYVDKVVELLKIQTTPVILVGHSMSGMVISQVAENIPEKIEQLVFIAGFVPSHRHSLMHEMSKCKFQTISHGVTINEQLHEISLNLDNQRIKDYFYNSCTEEDAQEAVLNLQKQPLQPLTAPVKIGHSFVSVKKVYVECLRDQVVRIEDQRRMYAKIECNVATLDTDHSPFISSPRELSRILLNNKF